MTTEQPTKAPQAPKTNPTRGVASRETLRFLREVSLLPVLVIVIGIGAFTNPFFFTASNLINVLSQTAVLGILVISQTLVLLTGRLDLSTESVVTLAPLIGVWLLLPVSAGGLGVGINPFLAIVLTLAIGVVIGVLNGVLIARCGLNPFIVTLAMLILLSGVAQGIAQGKTFYSIPEAYLYLGSASWFAIPVAVWVAGLLFLLTGFFLRYHKTGRSVYAVGGNERAAAAGGIRVTRIVIGVYVTSGLLAGLAGVLLAGRIGAVTATQGQNLIFSVLAACVIGGVSLNGGRGHLLGALTGVLLLAVVGNLLVLSNIASYWIDATYGFIILLALVIARVTGGAESA